MDKTLTAVLLKATDLRESDKTVRLFSAEEGLITAVLRGVRKPTAKLKFAAQPFALCRYEIAETRGRSTVTGATSIEDLYPLCLDPEKYAAACLLLEATERSATSVESGALMVVLLKSLKELRFGSVPPAIIAAKFLQKVLSMSGFSAPPKRVEENVDSPQKLLGFIAYKRLDELRDNAFPSALVRRALDLVARAFEIAYECALSSLSVLHTLHPDPKTE